MQIQAHNHPDRLGQVLQHCCKRMISSRAERLSIPASVPTQVDMSKREEVSVGFLSWLMKALLTKK